MTTADPYLCKQNILTFINDYNTCLTSVTLTVVTIDVLG